MKKRKRLFSIAAISFVFLGLSASCTGKSSTNSGRQTVTITEKAQKVEFKGTKVTGKTLGSILADPENPRWQKSKKNMEENGNAVGFSLKSAIFKTAGEQKTWIESNIANLDALIVGAADDTVVGSWTNTWKDATHPVIAFDRLIHATDRGAYNWYVTFDNTGVGKLQAKAILAHLYGDSTFLKKTKDEIVTAVEAHPLSAKNVVVALAGDPADNNAGLFYNGAMDIIKAASEKDSNLVVPAAFNTFQKVAQAGWNYNKGQEFLDTALQGLNGDDKNHVTAVLSPNDGMATAAINALKSNGLDPKTIYITGQDANDTAIQSIYLCTGQDMTIIKSDNLATAVALSLAKAVLEDTSKYNLETIASDDLTAIQNKIKKDYPSVDFVYDGTQYKTSDGHPVHTLLLTPIVMDKDNLSTYYDVKVS